MPFPTLLFSGHAVRRMLVRGVDEAAVRAVLDAGDAIENYPDDTPYPRALYLGFLMPGKPLHVVAADDVAAQYTIVITVYEPDPGLWDATFRQRKTS